MVGSRIDNWLPLDVLEVWRSKEETIDTVGRFGMMMDSMKHLDLNEDDFDLMLLDF